MLLAERKPTGVEKNDNMGLLGFTIRSCPRFCGLVVVTVIDVKKA